MFRNTDVSEQLLRPGWAAFAHFFGGVWHQAAGALDASGQARFPELRAPISGPGSRLIPKSALSSTSRWSRAKSSERSGFDRVEWRDGETVVDVGGGNGSLLTALLERHPGLGGIVFDLPETVRDEALLGDRIRFVEGSFFESVRRATSTSCRRSSTTGTTSARPRSCGRSAPARRPTRA